MTRTNTETTEANQSLLRAARSGNVAKIIDFLETGTDINTSNDIGLTALHLAAKDGHINVVKELINRGARLDLQTQKGNTPLHIASLAGKTAVAEILVANGASVNQQSKDGFTPLYMAAQENHLDIVTMLLQNGADITITTNDGFTPLAVAIQQSHERIVNLLLQHDSQNKKLGPLHIAVKKNDVSAVTLLLNNADVEINRQSPAGFTPLHVAAHYGCDQAAALLIEAKADVNFQAKNNITPLHVAAKWGRSGMLQILLDAGALISCRTRDGLTPLHCAARSGYAQLCEKLIDHGADVLCRTRSGLTPLHMASQGDHDDAVRILLLKKSNINDTSQDLLTPLHITAHYGNEKVARVLLDRRCDPNPRAMNGFTPLHIACKKHNSRIVDLLLKYGGQLEATTETGLTPLHVSAFVGARDAVELLLNKSANIEHATMRGETALHLATRNNQVEIVKMLLNKGALPDAKARENQTSLHLATKNGNLELMELFLKSEADPNVATRDNYTALHIAAKDNRSDAILLLLDEGANIEAETKRGFTPLHIAAKYNQVAVAKTLLMYAPHHANVNATGKNGLTPLHVATHYNHEQMARLLLDFHGDPKCKAKNGYTPLHISSKKNSGDLATLLLASDADSNAESRNGFSPLQLAAQEGHSDIVSLLLQHRADVNHKAKNGLTSLHLTAQEDKVTVAKILVANNAEITPRTNAGYTPLHTAAHFGQANMARYLISLMTKEQINDKTELGFTPLHLAAQQGHLQIINLLLENNVDPNIKNNQGWTAAHIARKQHYLNIFEILRKVTTEVISWEVEEEEETEEIIILEKPEHMGEHAVSDSEDEEDGAAIRKYNHKTSPLTIDANITTTNGQVDEDGSSTGHIGISLDTDKDLLSPGNEAGTRMSTSNDDIWNDLIYMKADHQKKPGPQNASTHSMDSRGDESYHEANQFKENETPIMKEINTDHLESQYKHTDWDFEPENVPIVRKPISSGFLVSFMIDARGGCMQAQRFSALRFYVPSSAALGPTRIVCRLIKPSRLTTAPALNDGDGFACRIMEMGPANVQFNQPILIEVPHYASLRGRDREIIILRSDNGDTWKEHPIDASDQAIQSSVGLAFDGLQTNEEIREKRIHRILTSDFPQYFALITRIRQEVSLIGPEGLVMSSSVVPQVQAVFPESALLKKTRVGIQAHLVSTEQVQRLLGNRVSCSPIISIEPRRRKFHKPITLTVPLPPTIVAQQNQHNSPPNLRLLCSITGGASPAVWEDITGSTPLSFQRDCVSFTTTVSARLWLIDCPNTQGVAEMATVLYRESIVVPYLGQLVVYGRRHSPEEAQLRVLALTDDPLDKTLECQERYQLLASGPPNVELLHRRPHWIETAGNLVPVTKTGDQLSLTVEALAENRVSFLIRVKDLALEARGKLAFMLHQRQAQQGSSGAQTAQKPITTLEIVLPTEIITPTDTLRRQKKKQQQQYLDENEQSSVIRFIPADIARSELDLKCVADQLGGDWKVLARQLGLDENGDDWRHIQANNNDRDCAYALLCMWQSRNQLEGDGNQLERALRDIGREDVVKCCMVNIQYVKDDAERENALKHIFNNQDENNRNIDFSFNNGFINSEPNKTASVDESLVVEVGDDTASQRAKDIHTADYTDENEDTVIVPDVDPRRINQELLRQESIGLEEKTEVYLKFIESLEQNLPEPKFSDVQIDGEEVYEHSVIMEDVKDKESAVPSHLDKPFDDEDSGVAETELKKGTLRTSYAEYKPKNNETPEDIDPEKILCEYERRPVPEDSQAKDDQNPSQ